MFKEIKMLNETLKTFLESIFVSFLLQKSYYNGRLYYMRGFLMLHLQSTEIAHLFCRGMQEQPQSLTN